MKNPNREAQIVEMYKTGHSMPEIGKLFEVTRQRIQQILAKHKISFKDKIKLPKPPTTSTCSICNKTFTYTTKWQPKTCSKECQKYARIHNSPSRKLTESDIPNIRNLYWKEHQTYKTIAEKYNVTIGLICHIINGKAWNHVKDKVDTNKTQAV